MDGKQTGKSLYFYLTILTMCASLYRGLQPCGVGGNVSVFEMYLLSRSRVLCPFSLSGQIVLAKIFYLLQELLSFQHSKMSTSFTVPSLS